MLWQGLSVTRLDVRYRYDAKGLEQRINMEEDKPGCDRIYPLSGFGCDVPQYFIRKRAPHLVALEGIEPYHTTYIIN
jgi:hypothetical protein